jgi:hypothetical protein
MHWDWRWFAGCVLAGVVLTVCLEFLRRRCVKRPHEVSRIWQCCRYQGGGKVYTPIPMTEQEATEYASTLGSILWIDRTHGFIFYRPTSGL